MKQWLNRFVANTRYVMQPYLPLNTPEGRPYDLRMLIQKNERGEWMTTGMAIRTGKPHGLTSNLHGGGRAEKAVPFLLRHFHRDQVSDIMEKIRWLAAVVPPHIERHHGRLLELGLDVGIDTDGRIWLLEVNSKPGRSVFVLSGQKEVFRSGDPASHPSGPSDSQQANRRVRHGLHHLQNSPHTQRPHQSGHPFEMS